MQVVRLDDFMENKPEKVTFLKLDVEGSELAALEGSLKIIQTHHPKLAISIYHRFNDLWELQLYLHSVAPGYKFYIRHHSVQSRETILYGRYEE